MEKPILDKDLAAAIDYTLLKPETTKKDIERLCKEAIQYGFCGVCVPPYMLATAKQLLKNNNTRLITVIGFPMGYSATNTKAEETKKAINDGADEVDMVVNVSALKSGNLSYVKDDIQSITTLCRLHSKVVKIIIETTLLTPEEIAKVCEICADAKVDFVKTSTGFFGNGADIETIKLLRSLLPKGIKIKASGGIRTREQAVALIKAGAARIGTSAAVDILEKK